MKNPLVSFIIPSYNHEKYIYETIASVLNQSFNDFEVIIIDDCSTDNSSSIIKSFHDSRIVFIQNEQNLGGSLSFKRAFAQSRGKYIVNLDSDDTIDVHKTEKQLAEIQSNDRYKIIGSYINVIDESGNRHPLAGDIEDATNQPFDFNLLDTWCIRNALCRSSTMIDREVHEKLGHFEPEMKRAPDFEFWTRILDTNWKFKVIPEKLTNYRLHSKGVTHGNPLESLLEISYIFVKNLLPVLRRRALYNIYSKIMFWHIDHPEFLKLKHKNKLRMLACLSAAKNFVCYSEYYNFVMLDEKHDFEEVIGESILAILKYPTSWRYTADLENAVKEYEKGRQEWFIPRIEHLERTVAEYEKGRQEWFIPRIEHLERIVAEYEKGRQEWSIPRIEHLERTVAEYEKGRQEWFIPRIEHLERTVAEYEKGRQEWFIPRIEYLERTVAEYEKGRQEWFIPRIEHLERTVAEYEKIKQEWFIPRIEHLERIVEQYEKNNKSEIN